MSDVELAWFGGWVSADGTILAEGPTIKFAICDRDPLQKFADLFGNHVRGPFKPSGFGKQPRFEWSVRGRRAVWLIALIFPWLSDRYQNRATIALEAYQAQPHSRGRKLSIEQVDRIRSSNNSGRQLAREFGISDSLVSAIRRGRAWR